MTQPDALRRQPAIRIDVYATLRDLAIDASVLTPQEKTFIDAPAQGMAEQMSWRVEAASMLAWALSPSSVSLGPAEGALDVDNLVHVRKAIGAGERLSLRPAGGRDYLRLQPRYRDGAVRGAELADRLR